MLLTVPQAAKFLGVQQYKIHNMIYKGVIPCIRQDSPRRVLLKEADLRAFKQAQDILISLKQAA